MGSWALGGGRTPASSSEKAEKQTDWRVVLTTVAIFVMFVIERGDDAVLPSLYAPVGAALVATPRHPPNVRGARRRAALWSDERHFGAVVAALVCRRPLRWPLACVGQRLRFQGLTPCAVAADSTLAGRPVSGTLWNQ